ncbi:hypothetical protein [Amycolatopsis jejuensis]|uniref:hypothetical protein n=1 Tax=Amycolatopsis jejuensis TaxID=330084 RepID=UPI000526CC81|nr:hypothetical protein [Amycolatopsis jejuensis]
MTAPTKSRRASASTTVERETQNTITQPEAPVRKRTTAAERAYARRAQRADLLRQRAPKKPTVEPEPLETTTVRTRLKLHWPRSRASFVLVMMGLLAIGVASTLWLTTQAIADSYRLEKLRTENASLAEAKDRLVREVAKAQSPAQLAPAAKALGMVPGGDPARIIVGKDGKTTVVGDPTRAQPQEQDVTAPPAGPSAPQEGGIEGDLSGTPAGTGGGQ